MKKIPSDNLTVTAVQNCNLSLMELNDAMAKNARSIIRDFIDLNGTKSTTSDGEELTYYKFTKEESEWVGDGLSFNQGLVKNYPTVIAMFEDRPMIGYDEFDLLGSDDFDGEDEMVDELTDIDSLSLEDMISICLSLSNR